MNDLLVVIGVILFPGIVATIITDKIIVHMKSWGSLDSALFILLFSAFSPISFCNASPGCRECFLYHGNSCRH